MTTTNFAVPVPEAGANAIATFSITDLRVLKEKYGGDYVSLVMQSFDLADVDVIEHVATVAIKGGSPHAAMEALSVEDLSGRLADALMLRLRGKTVAEIEQPPAVE